MTNPVYESMAAPRTARAQFTILLVEDDPSDTELILHAIEQAELKAIEGELKLEVRATAEGALRCLNEQPVDLVLTDMVLPGQSGLDLVGTSPGFQEIMRQVREAAQVRSTVLIMGETGTGKGLIAHAIHEQSREREKPYQVIDCTTVPEGMIESELFGHVRGAFTGAVSNKPGLIELADGGSVFLDEIGELPLPLQVKLLRVLEDSEVRPVGGTRVKRVDMRFIAASNQDLEGRASSGAFRKDLYYRLAVVTIRVPPLRERVEDILVIARHLVTQFGREMSKPRCFLDSSAMTELAAYHWPGNVRELRNVVERAVILATEEAIRGYEIRSLLPS